MTNDNITYVRSAAIFSEEFEGKNTIARDVVGYKELLERTAKERGKKVVYFHLTLTATLA